MLYELDIIDAVCTELENRGYVIIEKKKEIKHKGIDIIAKMINSDTNERFYIEAVGGTSSDKNSRRYGKPFDSSQCKVHVAEQLYSCAEILSKPKIGGITYKVGMAFEDNEHYRRYIGEIRNTIQRLELEVMFINNSKEVKYL